MRHELDCVDDEDCECAHGEENEEVLVILCPYCKQQAIYTQIKYINCKLQIIVSCDACGFVTDPNLDWYVLAS